MNYVFYDFETSGLNYYFDQPIQLAAKLVDENFNVLDELNEKCRLRDGVIPSPIALLITKTNLKDLSSKQSFYEFMDKIHQKLSSWSPAIFIGYNNINFDEKFLRSSLYHSLHAPYLTNTNNNSRTDLFKIILSICNLDKPYINIPIDKEKGRKSLKLEKIAENNKIKHEFAHDAMSDVDATLGVAEIIKNNDPDLWEHLMVFRNHNNVREFIEENKICFLPPTTSTGDYTPVCYLTSNPDNAKELIFFNLCEEVTDEIISSRTRNIGSLFKNKILKKVKSNDYPILLKYKHLDDTLKEKYSKDKNNYDVKFKLLNSSSNFVMNINQYLVDQLADYQVDNRDYLSASEHVDEMLYNGFTGPSDWALIKKIDNLNKIDEIFIELGALEDKRLVELYKRKLYSDKQELLPEKNINNYKAYISNKIFDDSEKVPWTTISKAKAELVKASSDSRFANMQDEIDIIGKYIDKLEKDFSS
tara:strand:+ start:658 stop:2079 length:1422 start_codon:yes stop_codon:yes gene_type:complete